MRDDLIPEEHVVVYEALDCLSDKEMYDRVFRLRRAVQLNATKQTLPPAEWIPLEEDVPYLWRHIDRISMARKERDDFDAFVPGLTDGPDIARAAAPPKSRQ